MRWMEYGSRPVQAVKGGQFGLSLGRLLSKGGMMKLAARVYRPLVG
jgi:hypothetical protein